ncbi:MAG: hypothetical protein EOP83_33910 [Verrucomicrobiaceae bacterium]|nr:MAG: hypothetical protein EOP83_33910 [Verrucomicrobiaceae bacterium]
MDKWYLRLVGGRYVLCGDVHVQQVDVIDTTGPDQVREGATDAHSTSGRAGGKKVVATSASTIMRSR